MKQTLNTRLIRAGLTFIILGSVAVILPQQSGAVNATECDTGQHTYVFGISKNDQNITNSPALKAVGDSVMLGTFEDGNSTSAKITYAGPVGQFSYSVPSGTVANSITVTDNSSDSAAHNTAITATFPGPVVVSYGVRENNP